MEHFSQIVTVKSFTPIYKERKEADNIQVVNFEENDFTVVSQKSLYKVGDKGLYIFPDTNLPYPVLSEDNAKASIILFKPFLAPEGLVEKSKLGKDNAGFKTRVRDIKFGFVYSDGTSVFSQGILVPMTELPTKTDEESWDTVLGLYKEDREAFVQKTKQLNSKVPQEGVLPQFIHKSDETHFQKNSHSLEFPVELIVMEKIDGSSSAVFWLNKDRYGICQRNLEKKIDYIEKIYDGFRKKYDYATDSDAWFNLSTKLFVSNEDFEAMNNPFVEKRHEDNYTIVGRPILELLKQKEESIAVRMEIFGAGLNASSVNPHCRLPLDYVVYGIDDLSTGEPIRVPQEQALAMASEMGLKTAKVFVQKVFTSKEELLNEVKAIIAAQPNPMEGVVIRTAKTNNYSAKYLNSEYDTKK